MGEVRSEGLVYRVLPDGASVALVGWYGTAPEGDVLVPASVNSGEDSYTVVHIGQADGNNLSCKVFADSKVTTLTLPSSVQEIIEGALSGCPTLARIEVSPRNETFSSFDGMLFSKDLSSLLTVPEGKEGAAHIPDQTITVPAKSLSQTSWLQSVEVGEGSVSFASRNGVLYSKDMKTLIACPPGAGKAAVIPAEVERIGEQAFAGCSLASITALGFVSEIAPDAFTDETKANALVALPAGEDYDERKVVWETAGFSHFAEPAKPGDTSEPAAPESPESDQQASGLAYTLLDDYTLSVFWRGSSDPVGDVEVPEIAEVGGVAYRVSTLALGAFANRATLTSVKLPSTVTSLGDAAFAGCANLQTVALPEGLRTIGDRAFEATGLTDVWLPESITSLGARAFAACSSLARVVAQGTPQVASDALAECSNTTVFCPAGSEDSWNVGLPAAGNHLAPYGITLPEEPLALEVDQSASLLTEDSLKAPEPIEVAYAYAAKPVSIDGDGIATGKAPGTSEVVVTLALDNKELTRAARSVEVTAASANEAPAPESTLDPSEGLLAKQADTWSALRPDTPLMAATVSPLALNEVFDYEYEGSSLRYQVFREPQGAQLGACIVITKTPDPLKPYLTGHVTIPDTVVHNGVTYQVERLQSYAFSSQRMETITLPSQLKMMVSFVFTRCPNLKSIFLPKTLTSIGINPFMGCKSLADIQMEEGNPNYTVVDGVLYDKNMTTLIGGTPATVTGKFSVPEGVATVRVNAFLDCVNLTSLYIPKSVTDFGGNYNIITTCINLAEIVVDPENPALASVDGVLYEKNEQGQKVVIAGCSPISVAARLNIPDTVQDMDQAAFSHVKTLEHVTVPPSVARMKWQAFEECENLVSAVLERTESMAVWGGAFAKDYKLEQILALPSSISVSMSEGGSLFHNMDASQVTVHCPESARQVWAAHGARVVPFATNMPGTIGLPQQQASSTVGFSPSIPADAPFSSLVTLRHSLEAGSSGITMQASADGRQVTFSHVGGGTATLTTQLMYKNSVLATSTSTVSVENASGPLPTQTDVSNTNKEKASWELTSEGTLIIKSTEPVGNFGWTAEGDQKNLEHWGALRNLVKSVDTSGLTGTTNMDEWFRDMPNLATLENVHLPQGITSAANLFNGSGITSVPATFMIPDGVETVDGMFNGCTALTQLPDTFALPDSVKNLSWLFANTPQLSALPKDFGIPAHAENMQGTFASCTWLREVPDTIVLPDTLKTCGSLFEGCSKLISLPEDFRIPANVETANSANIFSGCSNLTVLPAKFSMPARLFENPQFTVLTSTILQYAGSDTGILSVTSAQWSRDKRTLVVPKNDSALFKLSAKDGSGGFDVWTVAQPNVSTGTVVQPAAPLRSGQRFVMWYADEACTKPFDFSKAIQTQSQKDAQGHYSVYGVYAQGEIGGLLPTQNGLGNAFWAFDESDGTLFIGGQGTIERVWEDGQQHLGDWGPYREQVKKVVMQPTVKVRWMNNWFYGMSNLVDASQVFIPVGTQNVHRAFFGCTNLKSLPEGFSLPSSVTNFASAFAYCASLTSLPSSFVFPQESLADNVTAMFMGCSQLTSLPEEFAIPQSVRYLDFVFRDCPSLTTLPVGFSFPAEAAAAATSLPFGCVVPEGQARVFTHYSGMSRSVLDYDWESQGRTLVVDTPAAQEQRVTFKVQSATADESGVFPWETRSVAWSNKQGITADPGAPVLYGYTFSGWCTDEECLQPFDFATPLTAETTLYGTWVIAGGKNSQDRTGGELPVVAGSGSAWWRITADGTLSIKGDGSVTGLGFWWSEATSGKNYWEPYRSHVSRIRMDKSLKVGSMIAWFCRMPNLVDVSEVFVPEGCSDVRALFYLDSALTELPSGFYLPDSVTIAEDFLQSCTSITKLPESFVLPPNLTTATSMFRDCTSLTSLPQNFTIPNKAENVSLMFQHSGLAALPENFSIPDSVTNMNYMFLGCNSLTVFPANFDFPLETAETATDPFLCTKGTVETYFAGGAGSTSSVMKYTKWASQNRTITTDVPAGKALVNLMLPNAANAYELYSRQLVDADSQIAEPAAPVRQGYVFLGWYNQDGTTKFDFATGTVPAGGLELYGKYYKKSGELPTIDNQNNASWELAEDGTLTIKCENNATIASLWPDFQDDAQHIAPVDDYWSPMRSGVKRVVMEPGVKAVDMRDWFGGMVNLVDVSQVWIPEGATSVRRLFHACSALKSLPEAFTIPEGVTDVTGLVRKCINLQELPQNFRLPSTLVDAPAAFEYTGLKALPQGFVIPKARRVPGGYLQAVKI